MEASLNIVKLAGASIANSHKACVETLTIIRVMLTRKIFPWPLTWLQIALVSTLVPTPLHSPLFIVEFVLLLGLPLYVYYSVVHILIRGIMSY